MREVPARGWVEESKENGQQRAEGPSAGRSRFSRQRQFVERRGGRDVCIASENASLNAQLTVFFEISGTTPTPFAPKTFPSPQPTSLWLFQASQKAHTAADFRVVASYCCMHPILHSRRSPVPARRPTSPLQPSLNRSSGDIPYAPFVCLPLGGVPKHDDEPGVGLHHLHPVRRQRIENVPWRGCHRHVNLARVYLWRCDHDDARSDSKDSSTRTGVKMHCADIATWC